MFDTNALIAVVYHLGGEELGSGGPRLSGPSVYHLLWRLYVTHF